MNIQEKIKEWIKENLELKEDFVLVHPKDIKNGDYSFYHSTKKENDLEKLEKNKIKEIERIEIVGKFINFYLSKDFFTESVNEINEKVEKFGENNFLKNQKIIIEYTDPNPFKKFHIGHLMSNAIGEAIARIIETNGAEIKRLSYGGDIGLHVAKTIWGKMQKIEMSWGEAYVFGNNKYEEGSNDKNPPSLEASARRREIDELNKIIFDKSDPKINELYEEGREESISHFQKMFEKLGTKFDKNIWESEVIEDALKAVSLGLEKNILEKSEEAIIFRGENYGLHTRVFVNSKGIPTYEAKELGLGIKKYEDFSFDKSIVITANEQNEYFKVVLKAMELIKPEVVGKTTHIGHGMLRFASGKMSSRMGNVILAEDLIDQVKEKVLDKIKNPTSLKATTRQGRNFSDKEKEEISEIVAIGAIKYSILRQAIGGDIIFDFDKSISFEGDSGPYLQYTAVRTNSVLEKAKSEIRNSKSETNSKSEIQKSKKLEHTSQNLEVSKAAFDTWEITELERYLYRFPEVVERAEKEYAPHYIVTYLTELASIFNSFYASNKIIDESDPTSPYKIALTQATAHILKNGLNLLGIKVPERM